MGVTVGVPVGVGRRRGRRRRWGRRRQGAGDPALDARPAGARPPQVRAVHRPDALPLLRRVLVPVVGAGIGAAVARPGMEVELRAAVATLHDVGPTGSAQAVVPRQEQLGRRARPVAEVGGATPVRAVAAVAEPPDGGEHHPLLVVADDHRVLLDARVGGEEHARLSFLDPPSALRQLHQPDRRRRSLGAVDQEPLAVVADERRRVDHAEWPRVPARTLVGGMSAARGTPGTRGHTSGALPMGVYGPKAVLE